MKKLVKSLFFIMFLTSSLFAVRDFSFFIGKKIHILVILKKLTRTYKENFHRYTFYDICKLNEVKKSISKFDKLVQIFENNNDTKNVLLLKENLKSFMIYLDEIFNLDPAKNFNDNSDYRDLLFLN